MEHRTWLFLVQVFVAMTALGQQAPTSDLYRIIREKDSLLFSVGFNRCDLDMVHGLLGADLEFYHDQSGESGPRAEFIDRMRHGLCAQAYKAERVLDQGSLMVFPLMDQDSLYGAVQMGIHHFYAIEKSGIKHLTSTARFTHLWIAEAGEWKLTRALSFDHKDLVDTAAPGTLFYDRATTERWLKDKGVPTVGIGYINDGVIERLSVFGTLGDGAAAPVNTIWNVASLTKPVTALVALKLVALGRWDLDEPIGTYFTDPDVANDANARKLTTRIILSHRTGFPNSRSDTPSGKLSFAFEPGTKYQYSGEGYECLRKALEAKFHTTLDQLAQELVFTPLNMHDTRFFWDNDVPEGRFAHGHNAAGEAYGTTKTRVVNAADDLLTTVEDYCKFMVHVMNGAGLPDTLWNDMTADHTRINDRKHFGLGWWVDERINPDADMALVHGGDDVGVHAIAFILPRTKRGLLICTNSDNGTSVFEGVLLHFLGADGQGILTVETGR